MRIGRLPEWEGLLRPDLTWYWTNGILVALDGHPLPGLVALGVSDTTVEMIGFHDWDECGKNGLRVWWPSDPAASSPFPIPIHDYPNAVVTEMNCRKRDEWKYPLSHMRIETNGLPCVTYKEAA